MQQIRTLDVNMYKTNATLSSEKIWAAVQRCIHTSLHDMYIRTYVHVADCSISLWPALTSPPPPQSSSPLPTLSCGTHLSPVVLVLSSQVLCLLFQFSEVLTKEGHLSSKTVPLTGPQRWGRESEVRGEVEKRWWRIRIEIVSFSEGRCCTRGNCR